MVDLVYVFDEKSLMNNFETTLEFFSKSHFLLKKCWVISKLFNIKNTSFSGGSRNSKRGFQVCM